MSPPSKARLVDWAGPSLTLLMAVIAFTVQWGVVTTKLDQMEKRLDEFLTEARTLRHEYAELNKRLAFLEGQLKVKP